MRFFKEANVILEVYKEPKRKDVARGTKMYGTQQQEGSAGMTSPTVGKSEYGHFTPKDFKKNPLADTKATSVRKTEIVLRNVFRILKGNPIFRDKIDAMLEKYSKSRKQIRSDQEQVLSYNPGKIDSLFNQIDRLKKIVANLPTTDKRHIEFKGELKEAEELYQEYSEELDQVYDQMLDVIGVNEQTSFEYQEKIIDLCQKIAQDEYNKLTKELTDKEPATYKTFDEIEAVLIDDEQFDQEMVRLEHLNLILKEGEDNPLYNFFFLANEKYKESKGTDESFQKLVYRTHNITVETLWNRLPTSNFAYLYNITKDDTPLRPLTKGRRKQAKIFQSINDILNMIHTQEDYDTYKENIREMIDNMQIGAGRTAAVEEILNGPFVRRGATAVQRLRGLLRGILRECTTPYIESDDMFKHIVTKFRGY
jgi:hypothetical protein